MNAWWKSLNTAKFEVFESVLRGLSPRVMWLRHKADHSLASRMSRAPPYACMECMRENFTSFTLYSYK
jgi:hypothetical protein